VSVFKSGCVCVCVLREASTLAEDLKGLVEELEQDQQMSLVSVELVDDELARVYANSSKAQVVHSCHFSFLSLSLSNSVSLYHLSAKNSLVASQCLLAFAVLVKCVS